MSPCTCSSFSLRAPGPPVRLRAAPPPPPTRGSPGSWRSTASARSSIRLPHRADIPEDATAAHPGPQSRHLRLGRPRRLRRGAGLQGPGRAGARGARERRRTWPRGAPVNDHVVIPASALKRGENTVALDVHGGRRGAEPERRLPVHALRARPGALQPAGLRPAQPQGAGALDPAGPGRLAGGGQRAAGSRSRARPSAPDARLPGDAAHPHLPVRLRGGRLPGGGGGGGRAADAHVPPRDRHAPRWRATATRSSSSTRKALAWLEDYTGIPYPFQKFDFVADPLLPVRRHGAPGRDLLQRVGPPAGRVAPRRARSWAGRASSRTRPPTCGSATWSP